MITSLLILVGGHPDGAVLAHDRCHSVFSTGARAIRVPMPRVRGLDGVGGEESDGVEVGRGVESGDVSMVVMLCSFREWGSRDGEVLG